MVVAFVLPLVAWRLTSRPRTRRRPDLAPTGSGEPSQAPIAAAIANAFFDATGVRIRRAPMKPALVRHVLEAAAIA